MSGDTHPEPKNLSIIRERLRKSGSTLVFGMRKITDEVLEAVVKYLPEVTGKYEVRLLGTGNRIVGIYDSDKAFELWIEGGEIIRIQEDKFCKYQISDDMDEYVVNRDEGVIRMRCARNDINIKEYKFTGKKYSYKTSVSGRDKFTCYDFSAFALGVSRFDRDATSFKIGMRNEVLSKFKYSPPLFPYATGTILYYKYNVNFTDKVIVNACLQIKPKNDCKYDFHFSPMLRITEIRGTITLGQIWFENNKITHEESNVAQFYSKTIIENGYITCNLYDNTYHNYKFDKANKLLSILVRGDNSYDINIINNNEIKICQRAGNIRAEDVAIAFGKSSPPQYKFEYLV